MVSEFVKLFVYLKRTHYNSGYRNKEDAGFSVFLCKQTQPTKISAHKTCLSSLEYQMST
jgi:hypothetical protein